MYRHAFEDMNALAVQRHMMYRSEFEELMGDRRVHKYFALADDGAVLGLATHTFELDAVPLISPAYFERRWPDLYAQKRICYIGMVVTDRDRPTPQVFARLVEAVYRATLERGGIGAMDFCRHNEETHRISRTVQLMLNQLSGGRCPAERLDEQTYWLFDSRPGQPAAPDPVSRPAG
jgi:hypothetical protein